MKHFDHMWLPPSFRQNYPSSASFVHRKPGTNNLAIPSTTSLFSLKQETGEVLKQLHFPHKQRSTDIWDAGAKAEFPKFRP